MKRIAFSLLVAALLMPLAASAQQSKTDERVEFRPHWYSQFQGGAAYTVGETSFFDLLNVSASVSLGYQFTPVFGIRSGFSANFGKGNVTNPKEIYDFTVAELSVDGTLDLASLFNGYNHRRLFRPYLLAGGALLIGRNNGANDVSGVIPSQFFTYLWDGTKVFGAGRFGIGTDVRINDLLSLTFEVAGNVTSDHLNSKKAGNPDFLFTGQIGIKTPIGGKAYRESAVWLAAQTAAKEEAEAAARFAAEEAARRAQLEAEARERAAKEEAERLAAERRAAEEAAARAAAEHAAIAAEHGFNTFFALDSSRISKAEKAKLAEAAEWLKANPEFTVTIVGYADRQTGRPQHNLKLSERRVNAVRKVLEDCGVAASRITTDFKGDTVQPFAENVKNRVVIGTLE